MPDDTTVVVMRAVKEKYSEDADACLSFSSSS